jgi:hypothetical protein
MNLITLRSSDIRIVRNTLRTFQSKPNNLGLNVMYANNCNLTSKSKPRARPPTAGFIRDLENLEKSWNLKIGLKVMENHENVKKTWKSHGICHPVKN